MCDEVVAVHASGGGGDGPAEDPSEGEARASAGDGGRREGTLCPRCVGRTGSAEPWCVTCFGTGVVQVRPVRICPVCLGPVPATRRSTAVYCRRRCYTLANQRRFRGQDPAGPTCKPWGRGGPGPAGAVRLTRPDLVAWVTARGAATRQPAERVIELAVALYQATVASLQAKRA